MVANGFEGVAWMTGGGAEHSAGLGRLVAFAASGGISGIVQPSDLRVVATTPSANGFVHIGVGAASIRNRYSAARSESYYVRNLDVTDVAIPSSGSSARSHLLCVRVEDPQYGGQSPTAVGGTVKNGPYVFPYLHPDVGSNVERAEEIPALANLPVYAIARIDMPANATVVQQSYIKQVRVPVKPSYMPWNALQKGPATKESMLVTDTALKNWPSNLVNVPVPAWATHADCEVQLLGMKADDQGDIDTLVDFGGVQGPAFHFDYNGAPGTAVGFVETMQHDTFSSFEIPVAMRGTTQVMRLKARRVFTVNRGNIWIASEAQVRFRVEFFEKATL